MAGCLPPHTTLFVTVAVSEVSDGSCQGTECFPFEGEFQCVPLRLMRYNCDYHADKRDPFTMRQD